MIDAKKELQYRLAVRMLEHLAEIGLLSAEELSYAKRLALSLIHISEPTRH